MKSTGLRRPTPVGAPATAASKVGESAPARMVNNEPVPDNDPIALTNQQREALGGLNNLCTDVEAQKKKFRVFRASKLVSKGAALIDVTGGAESGPSTGARPATAIGGAKSSGLRKPTAATRPATAASRVGAKKTSASEAPSVSANENLAGVDDPIAVSM